MESLCWYLATETILCDRDLFKLCCHIISLTVRDQPNISRQFILLEIQPSRSCFSDIFQIPQQAPMRSYGFLIFLQLVGDC